MCVGGETPTGSQASKSATTPQPVQPSTVPVCAVMSCRFALCCVVLCCVHNTGLKCKKFPAEFGQFPALETLMLRFNNFNEDTFENVADVSGCVCGWAGVGSG